MNHAIEILLVEDNPGDVELTRETFRKAKINNNIHVAMDGDEALAFMRKQGKHEEAPRPDLVLLDLNLPRKTGHEVLQEIKKDASLRTIPVVVLTTSERDEDILRSYNLCAACYISKPPDLDQFRKVVTTINGFWFSIVKFPPL